MVLNQYENHYENHQEKHHIASPGHQPIVPAGALAMVSSTEDKRPMGPRGGAGAGAVGIAGIAGIAASGGRKPWGF